MRTVHLSPTIRSPSSLTLLPLTVTLVLFPTVTLAYPVIETLPVDVSILVTVPELDCEGLAEELDLLSELEEAGVDSITSEPQIFAMVRFAALAGFSITASYPIFALNMNCASLLLGRILL